MKTLYLDCGMGAAGDMLTAALLELLPDPDAAMAELDALGIPGVTYVRERAESCGIVGTHMSVLVHGAEEGDHPHEHDHEHEHDHDHEHDHEHDHDHHHDHDDHHHHHHSGLHDIEHLVSGLSMPEEVKGEVLSVYRLIAEAEGHVHGTTVDQIHFHEVGALDAVADVAAVCLLMRRIAPDEVVASPVHVGSGTVRCAHGILPVPAPATAWLLRGIPIYGGSVDGELCTPTGAALLRWFVTRFGDMPVLRPVAVGHGMGKRDFSHRANCVRAILGESEDRASETVLELRCNVDDMTAEEIAFAMERIFDGGAKEVFTVPAGMKKSRPGTLLVVLCRERDREAVLDRLFRYTTTLGVRESMGRRYVLDRRTETLETPFGPVRRKRSEGYGVSRSKYEYEDLARIARERDLSVAEARALLDGAARKEGNV